MDHVITEIIETKFVIGTVGDVRQISLAAGFAVGFVFVDTIHGETQPFEDRTVPFRVTTGEIIVYRHDMHPFAGQTVEIGREGGNEGLTFTGSHFCDLALMEDGTSYELNIVMHHIPGDGAACGHPGIVVDALMSVDADIFFFYAEIAVQLGSGGDQLGIFLETAGGLFDNGEGFREKSFENLFDLFVTILFEAVDFLVEGILSVDIAKRKLVGLPVEIRDAGIDLLEMAVDTGTELYGFRTQFVVGKAGVSRKMPIDLADERLDSFNILFRL